MTAQIFISHSSHSKIAQDYLDAMMAAFKGQDQLEMAPWLDRANLAPGDAWRDEIFKAIRSSHGAILLLSKDAADSAYVEIEASVLRYRSRTDGNFPYLIVQIDADARNLPGVFAHMNIREHQLIRHADPNEAAKVAVSRLKDLLWLDLIAPRSYFEELRGFIAADLERARLTAGHVATFGRRNPELCKIDPYRPCPGPESCRWMANILLAADLDSAKTIFSYLYDCLPELDAREIMRKILDRLAPLWVDEDVANAIATQIRGAAASRQLAVGYSDSWALDALVCRARSRKFGKPKMPLHLGEYLREGDGIDEDARAEWVKSQVLQFVDFRPAAPGRPRTPEKDQAVLKSMRTEDGTIIVSFSDATWWPPSGALLSALRTRLEPAVFCFRAAGDAPDLPVAYVGAMPEDLEENLIHAYGEILQTLDLEWSDG